MESTPHEKKTIHASARNIHYIYTVKSTTLLKNLQSISHKIVISTFKLEIKVFNNMYKIYILRQSLCYVFENFLSYLFTVYVVEIIMRKSWGDQIPRGLLMI